MVLGEVGPMSAAGAAEVEGSPSRSGLKICVTAGITETAAEKIRAVCYLKDAELCGLDC